ncbi:MAG: CPBP family intramembrane metalloprotease [Planctomycetes bacterium]|nr:CPBP family intramembrane metalloprotease [Planctomycetota bacterium]
MSGLRRARLAEPLLQLLAIAVVAALSAGAPAWWLPAMLGLAIVWPPAVAWRPLAGLAVLRTYLVWVLPWLLATVVYLRLLHACGHTVAPQPALVELAAHGLSAPGAWATILLVVGLAPVAEEILFRGYLYTGLATVLPVPAAQTGTAALFGLAHGLDHALPIAALGLLFGWLRHRHAALLPAMFAHALHNGITVLLALVWPGHLDLLFPR